MNRLWLRLTVAFVAVTLVGVGAVALLADWNANSQFRQYVYRQDELAQKELADQLANYYQQRGSWDGVDSVLPPFGRPGVHRGPPGPFDHGRPDALIADTSGKVVYDPSGQRTGSILDSRARE